MFRKSALALLYLLLTLLPVRLLATQDQTFGLGGIASGRVSTLASDPENPFASITNPSLLPLLPESGFAFSTSFVEVKREPLQNVTLDSSAYRTREGRERSGTYDFPEAGASLWVASLQSKIALPRWTQRQGGLGLVASGPYGNLRHFRSGSAYDFSTLRYGTSDSQFKATLGAGLELIPRRLTFGAGLSVFISAAGDAAATVVSEDPTARLNLDVGLNTAAVAGLTYRHPDGESEHFFSVVYRQAIAPKFEQNFQGDVELGVGRGTAELPFKLETYLYYEPEAWDGEWQGNFGNFKVAVGLAFQRWTNYQPSYLVVESINADRKTVRSTTPALSLQDTFNPRVSIEVPRGRWTFATGYQYRPSPVREMSGPANLLDSDVHIAGAAIRYRLPGNEWFPLPLGLSVHGQFHHFSARQIEKSQGGFIGAPGFTYAGNAYNIGLLMETRF